MDIITWYFKSLFSCCLCVCFFSCHMCCILELKTAKGWFFLRVHLCIWAIGGHKLGTLSIRVHNSLTVHDNLWALKFDNFSEFQNIASESDVRSGKAEIISTFQQSQHFRKVSVNKTLQKKLCCWNISLTIRLVYNHLSCEFWQKNCSIVNKRHCLLMFLQF